ncbi:MAG TPA: SRPBCC domain-containing protein [Burkholderiales bacterium]|nr:SRPBCC domain-containing protein [Burkholderiales bacterium]
MHDIVTEIDLQTSAARVWAVLTDFGAYEKWNPVIQSVDGPANEGAKLRVTLRREALLQTAAGLLGGLKSFAFRSWCAMNGMRIAVRVTKLLPERELRWVGALPIPGTFRGEHYFKVAERGDGSVRFTQGEHYAGLLAPAFRDVMEAVNRQAMNAVNQALKDYVEASG